MNDFTIFAVDDDDMILGMVEAMLVPQYRLESFTSAEACLERIGSAMPGMLLLDIGLPGMDGYTLCRRLKDDAATRDVPILFVSAYDTLEARLAAFDAGGEDFIVKPFEPEVLLRKVQVAERIRAAKLALHEQVANADAELCGRIRDTLAIVTQGADGRLQGMVHAESRERSNRGLMAALASLHATVTSFTEVHERHRLRGSEIVFQVEQKLARSFVHLGLSEDQERHVEDLFRAGMADLMTFIEQGGSALQSSLGQLRDELSEITARV